MTSYTSYAQDRGALLGPMLKKIANAYVKEGEPAAERLAKLHGLRLRPDSDGVVRISVILEPLKGKNASSIDMSGLSDFGIEVDAASRSFVRVLVPLHSLLQLEGYPGLRVARASISATPAEAMNKAMSH